MDKFIDKQYKDYEKLSRYSVVPYFYNVDTKKYTYGTCSWLSEETPYQNYTVEMDDTLDSISLRAYGSPIYYWIIASFNRMTDCLQPLTVGDIIKIPSKSAIQFEEYN